MPKKLWNFLSSMRFAIFLLILLAAACAAASLVEQGQTAAWYQDRYSPRMAGLILALHMDDAFHSWWFVLLSGFLCLNLLLCNLVRFPSVMRRTGRTPRRMPSADAATAAAEHVREPEALFAALKMPKPVTVTEERTPEGTAERAEEMTATRTAERAEEMTAARTAERAEDMTPARTPERAEDMTAGMTDEETAGKDAASSGREILYAEKNRAGRWGAWVCHLGILLLIAGFSLGQSLGQEYTVYGVPGQSRPVGDTGLTVTIDDFRMDTRESGSVEQYTTDLTMTDAGGAAQSASASVNSPARLFGWSLYQNSTGWAAKMDILKDGEPLASEILCAGEYRPVPDKPELIVFFREFFPDYAPVPGSPPVSLTQELNNPAYLYMVYYMGEVLGMNVLLGDEPLTIDEYTITFTDPQRYSLVQVKRDPYAPLAFLGGLILTAGLFLAFYVQPAEVWAVRDGDGWTVRGLCRKGGPLFRDAFVRAVADAGGRIVEPAPEPPAETAPKDGMFQNQ